MVFVGDGILAAVGPAWFATRSTEAARAYKHGTGSMSGWRSERLPNRPLYHGARVSTAQVQASLGSVGVGHR